MSTLKGRKILLGISSGIAVYKLVEIISLLKSLGVELKAVMTNNAKKLIKKGLFECETYTELFIRYSDYSNYKENPQLFTHITLAKFPDVIVIAPATANIIAKIANGIADDLLTTIIITTKVKVFICPAMNVNMYQNKIVQDNLRKLRKYGFEFIGPNFGELACGDIGKGRLAEAKEISER
ncbi:MAG: flavoprotein, partial [Nanoarchaeota archaeon]